MASSVRCIKLHQFLSCRRHQVHSGANITHVLRRKSTVVSSTEALEHDNLGAKHQKTERRVCQHPEVDLSFCNSKEAYRSKTTAELLRSLLVFNLCSIPALVNRSDQVNLNWKILFISILLI